MLRLDGKGIDERDERGRHIFDDTLLIAINGSDETLRLALPKTEHEATWTLVFNTKDGQPQPGLTVESEGRSDLVGRSMVLFRTPSRPSNETPPEPA